MYDKEKCQHFSVGMIVSIRVDFVMYESMGLALFNTTKIWGLHHVIILHELI